MKTYTGQSLREMYLSFFQEKGHKVIPSASLIPENDPTVLFTTAGMHPLVPYLLGEKHPAGKRLTDVQKCVRTGDIDDVGDERHCTFFEMLGNWSLGDYFKQEMIPWSYEFLTGEKYLGIPSDKIAVTVFGGDETLPRDDEAAALWEKEGIKKENIYYMPRENNWWGPAGLTGPCGTDTEMFVIRKPKCSPTCNPDCNCGAFLEIWNDVFMRFNKQADGSYIELTQKNVDTGMGLERALCVLNGKSSVYETDIFENAIAKISELTGKTYGEDEETTKAFRVLLDHTRTATFMLGDEKGIVPSNTDQGYILRRIIRRAVRFGRKIDLPEGSLAKISESFIEYYKDVYPELLINREKIAEELNKEEAKFTKTLQQGLKEFEKCLNGIERKNAFMSQKDPSYVPEKSINGKQAFHLYDTYGFPVEITDEMAKERGYTVDIDGYKAAFEEHQSKSKAGSEQKFACGLADNKEATTKLHTATHLLHAALKKVLSPDVNQKGSNITEERLRFDFNYPAPMTAEQIKAVEDMVNDVIAQNIPVVMKEISLEEAKAEGFTGLFESKYGERVKTYTIGDFSKEICGGPHAESTGVLGKFKIAKEQSCGSGLRRIKAVLQND
ncbi:MAG: alanine--tRNA ligase [Clostridia bacterium]|nr:alanine--tRNA ligase [Clostridia bacterium]